MDPHPADAPSEHGPDDGTEPGTARDAAHWLAVVFMTAAPVVLLTAIYLWIKSLNA